MKRRCVQKPFKPLFYEDSTLRASSMLDFVIFVKNNTKKTIG